MSIWGIDEIEPAFKPTTLKCLAYKDKVWLSVYKLLASAMAILGLKRKPEIERISKAVLQKEIVHKVSK